MPTSTDPKLVLVLVGLVGASIPAESRIGVVGAVEYYRVE
jgi:hypothetical protein